MELESHEWNKHDGEYALNAKCIAMVVTESLQC
jgi:hypothetical protein